jgi:nucleotide-binding universal stress UspA family protein
MLVEHLGARRWGSPYPSSADADNGPCLVIERARDRSRMPEHSFRTIVVGVMTRQPDAVVTHAAALAAQLGARLVCASVDRDRHVVEEYPDGRVRSVPLDPDLADPATDPAPTDDAGDAESTWTDPDDRTDRFDSALESRLRGILRPTGVDWEVRALAGDPARALARLADTLDAMMIVVGTHEGGLRGSVRELFTGSVAAHLAHRQHRPVVVIPLSPVGLDAELPWDPGS